MKQKQSIKHFFFVHSLYHVSDSMGDDVLLIENYKENTFVIESQGTRKNNRFREELGEFALDMLHRKHNTDFAA